jgi:helix-turn-helix protein
MKEGFGRPERTSKREVCVSLTFRAVFAPSVRSLCEHLFVSKFAPRGAPDRQKLEELAREGASLREIGLALDRSIATVRYWLHRWEIARQDARLSRVDPATAPREVMRACARHGRTVYRLDKRGTYRCVLCSQERVAERRRRVKRILVDEAGGCCVVCGYDVCCAALQFHHVDPQTKSFALSHEGVTRSLARARAEAQKCVLLCANCHAEVESGLRIVEAPRGGFEPPRTD